MLDGCEMLEVAAGRCVESSCAAPQRPETLMVQSAHCNGSTDPCEPSESPGEVVSAVGMRFGGGTKAGGHGRLIRDELVGEMGGEWDPWESGPQR